MERILENLGNYNYRPETYDHFQNELNEYFLENGTGWKLTDDQVESVVRNRLKSFYITLKRQPWTLGIPLPRTNCTKPFQTSRADRNQTPQKPCSMRSHRWNA